MTPLRVIICQQDTGVARRLAATLGSQSHTVLIATAPNELRENIRRHRAQVVVLDIESAQLKDVKRLHEEFGSLCIVCTHRLADEEMWTAALNAGAADICSSSDTHGILVAAARYAKGGHNAAA